MKIVVLAGGLSTERDVSLCTGVKIAKQLRSGDNQVVLLDMFMGFDGTSEQAEAFFDHPMELDETLEKIPSEQPDLERIRNMRKDQSPNLFGPYVLDICRRADMVFMALHGADGENGKVQAAFDLLGIRYTGSGYLGSVLAMNKGVTKMVFNSSGIPTPPGYTVNRNTAGQAPEKIGFPCVVKPCCGGSSVGVSIVSNGEEYQAALEEGFRYEEELLVEKYIKGREFSVGVLDGRSLPVIEIIPREGFYDYKTKYQAGLAEDVCPAELPEEISRTLGELAQKVYQALHLKVYGRIDFLMDGEGRLYCLEANTLPGMTPTSLLPQEAEAAGIDYQQLCQKILTISQNKEKE